MLSPAPSNSFKDKPDTVPDIFAKKKGKISSKSLNTSAYCPGHICRNGKKLVFYGSASPYFQSSGFPDALYICFLSFYCFKDNFKCRPQPISSAKPEKLLKFSAGRLSASAVLSGLAPRICRERFEKHRQQRLFVNLASRPLIKAVL